MNIIAQTLFFIFIGASALLGAAYLAVMPSDVELLTWGQRTALALFGAVIGSILGAGCFGLVYGFNASQKN